MQCKKTQTLHQTTTALVHTIRVVHTYLCLCNALPARLLLLFLHEQKIEKNMASYWLGLLENDNTALNIPDQNSKLY